MKYKLSLMGSIGLRTYFYLKALKEKNIKIDSVFIYDYKNLDISKFKNIVINYKEFEFNFDKEMQDLLEFFDAQILDKKSINDLEEIVKNLNSNIIIFSGKGGEIVKPNILRHNRFLHIHPGKLPQYRGSTTLYYSLLKELKCYATAFFLEEKIDAGNIIKNIQFDILDIDFDYLYDPFIRTYLLIDVLKNENIKTYKQSNNGAKEYYIIHPVLKKIAQLKKEKFIEKNL
jgi:methionyl-tRNA formyltransferase